jgi:hypothetical protein
MVIKPVPHKTTHRIQELLLEKIRLAINITSSWTRVISQASSYSVRKKTVVLSSNTKIRTN